MGGFETSIVVRRPLGEVAAYLSDLRNDPLWRREWVDAEHVSAGPLRVGTTTVLFGEIWGRRMKAVRGGPLRAEPAYRVADGVRAPTADLPASLSGSRRWHPDHLHLRGDSERRPQDRRAPGDQDGQATAGRRHPPAACNPRRLGGLAETATDCPTGHEEGMHGEERRGPRLDQPSWEDVYAYVTSLDLWSEWRRDVVAGRLLTEGPLRVGTRAQALAQVLGRTVTIDVVVTASEPRRRSGTGRSPGPCAPTTPTPSRARLEAPWSSSPITSHSMASPGKTSTDRSVTLGRPAGERSKDCSVAQVHRTGPEQPHPRAGNSIFLARSPVAPNSTIASLRSVMSAPVRSLPRAVGR